MWVYAYNYFAIIANCQYIGVFVFLGRLFVFFYLGSNKQTKKSNKIFGFSAPKSIKKVIGLSFLKSASLLLKWAHFWNMGRDEQFMFSFMTLPSEEECGVQMAHCDITQGT